MLVEIAPDFSSPSVPDPDFALAQYIVGVLKSGKIGRNTYTYNHVPGRIY